MRRRASIHEAVTGHEGRSGGRGQRVKQAAGGRGAVGAGRRLSLSLGRWLLFGRWAIGKLMASGKARAGLWVSRLSALRPESVKANFVLVFRVPERRLLRADSPARGGGDTRWLAQNYTGRMIHTATKQDQLKLGSDKGLGRFLEARLVSPKGFSPMVVRRRFRIGLGIAGVRFGAGRASASGLWRMAVGAAVPRVAGRVAASVFEVSSTDVQGARARRS